MEKILYDGKLHIFILGSGGPINNEIRVTSSIAIIAEEQFLLFDVGPGTYRNADLLRLPVAHLSAIFITHFHSDHIGDLGEANMMSWANGRIKPLEIYGPPGIDKVVEGFRLAYSFYTEYRIAHHGEAIVPRQAGIPISKPVYIKDSNDRELCFSGNNLRVFAFKVDHSPIDPAYGYRIEYKGNIVVITGDTIKTDNLVRYSRNADILFCDAISYESLNSMISAAENLKQYRFAKILTDIQNYHMNPNIAATLANEANVKKLVIVHITPSSKGIEKLYLKYIMNSFSGEIIIAEDRMKFTLEPK